MLRVCRVKLWPGTSTHNLFMRIMRKLGRWWRQSVAPEVEIEAGAGGRGHQVSSG